MQRGEFGDVQMPGVIPREGGIERRGTGGTGAARQKCPVLANHRRHRHLRSGICCMFQKPQVDAALRHFLTDVA